MKSKILALSKNEEFKNLLKQKKLSNKYVAIFFGLLDNKDQKRLNISFVTKKKIGNAVKRNRIRRKLKAIVNKLLKIKGAINSNYTYIVFGKSKAYEKDHKTLFSAVQKSFEKF